MNLFPLLLAATLSSGNAEFDRTAIEGARSVAIRQAETRIAAEGPQAGKLRQLMLEDPKEFVSAAQAKETGRTLYRQLMDGELAAEKAKIDERLGLAKTPDETRLSAELADRAMARFDDYYAGERRAACAEQAKAIVSATRPTGAEFDAKPEDTLRTEMTARIASEQRIPVFEENRAYISEQIVDPVLASAKKERQRQTEYLMRARSEAVAPSKLADELKARLEQNLAERAKNADAAETWGLFPSVVERALPSAVERRTVERLVAQVEGTKLEVGADEVAETIRRDPAAHVKASDSARIFTVAYSSRMLAEALEKAVAEAPGSDRTELREFLAARLSGEAPAKAVERLVKRDVMPRWREVRKAVSERFAAETWPSLTDGTWYPSAELADEISARGDYAEAVKGWRGLAALKELSEAPRGVAVMEESAELADGRVAAAFERARNAVTTQSALVEKVHPEVLVSARARKDSFFRRTPDLKAVTAMLTEATRDEWEAVRLRTLWPDGNAPRNANDQHRELFPSVMRKIELLARVILEEMDTPSQKPEPEPDPSAEPPPDELTAFSIEIGRDAESIEVSLKSGGNVVKRMTVAPKKSEFERAMSDVTRTLGQDILKLK